ncbi:receptor-type tyrosine-protein phosphatase N2 isoform X2 [Nycticebus coucang]|uniref:receptor-type tyrosine-protein phosphatase N2 isoform X2 n=1 Tax=Nycticebus coucang TaxID=9470 RepID=UPI00234D35C4|nr:receptor-type tyrosine-protein phosphatase N2 isoform X2 [Nycticebus coucang]
MGPPLPLLLLLLLPPRVLPAAPPPVPRGRQLPGRLGCLLEDGLCGLAELCVDGLTWQDDYTQYVMAQELANLPKTYPRHPEASTQARAWKQSSGSVGRRGLGDDAALARALQRYLPYLGALSRDSAAKAHPRMEHGDPADEGADSLPESILTYMARTSALTYPLGPRAQPPEGLQLRTFSQAQPDELSPKADGGMDTHHLVAALGAYTAQRLPASSREDDLGPQHLLHVPPQVPRPLSALTASQKWPLPPGDSKEKPGTGEGALIQSLLRDLRRHQVDVESLSPLELNETPGLTTGVAQGVGPAGRWGGAEEQLHGPEPALSRDSLRDSRVPDYDDSAYKEVTRLSTTLGDVLRDPGARLVPGAPVPAKSLQTEMKKSAHPEGSLSSEEEDAGVENVRSQTYSKDLLERKPHSEPVADGVGELQSWAPGALEEAAPRAGVREPPGTGLQLEAQASEEDNCGYILTDRDPLSLEKGRQLTDALAHLLRLPASAFTDINVLGPAVTFKVSANVQNMTTADVAKATVDNKAKLQEASGLRVLQAGTGARSKLKLLPQQAEPEDSTKFVVLTLVSIACIVGVLLASGLIYCLRHTSHHKLKEKLSGLGGHAGTDATAAYQELCRQRMAARPPDRPEDPHVSRINSVSSQFSDGPIPSPSARSSTSSWSEEPVQSNMDISTGHMILSYMEDHLKNKNRLEKEWEALCAYQAEPSSSSVAQREENVPKNRSLAVLTYDHSRILLKPETSHSNSDYINASPIMDHDPRSPAYIATQGPLPATVADFWQMVWESGCAVIVMLAPLSENGVRQCHHYWPDEGSNLYHVYEVNLVSEHIWCEDFLVRSFYLKNLQTSETRTVTQFHFLSWYDQGVPSSARSLLDFRRKVNKCYRGRSCPIIVHCSDGAGRSGTYVLIDMVLNKMAKGAKEIDIAATLEHLRDQRPGMVQTKEQFEFALTAVAEEVNAILKALPQ